MTNLHELTAAGETAALNRALVADPDAVDSYRAYRGLEDIIIRHGLKGTPLHVAVAAGRLDCARLLLEHGADPSLGVIQSERGDEVIPYATALFLARETGRKDIVELLIHK